MKECTEFKEQLVAYLDGELSPDAEELVKQHLEQCAECRREAELLAALGQSLEALPRIEPALHHLEPICARLYQHRRVVRLRRAAVLVPLAAMLLFALVLWLPRRESLPPEAAEIVENLELLTHMERWENLPVLETLEELEMLSVLEEVEDLEES